MVEKIEWEILEATWKGLAAMANQYISMSDPWSALVEAQRLTEVEMREQGYEKEWRELTTGESAPF